MVLAKNHETDFRIVSAKPVLAGANQDAPKAAPQLE